MTDDYTPSINDFRELHMDKFTGSERVLAGELFDRAIAAHDAATEASALIAAADAMDAEWREYAEKEHEPGKRLTFGFDTDWLRARAATIAEGKTTTKEAGS